MKKVIYSKIWESFGDQLRFFLTNSIQARVTTILNKKERYIKFSLKLRIIHLNIVKECKVIHMYIIINVSWLVWAAVVIGNISPFLSRVTGSIQVHKGQNKK